MSAAMTLGGDELVRLAAGWMWPLARIAGFVAAAPVFGHRGLPARGRIGLALALALVIAPLVPAPAIEAYSPAAMVAVAVEVLTGLALGFAARLGFLALEVAGQQMAQAMGLGFAALVDPQTGVDAPMLGHLYVTLATLVFLGIDGHLVLLEVLAASFTAVPPGAGLAPEGLRGLVAGAGWLLAAGVTMALPVVVALLAVNVAFGVVTRTAPQLNVFAVGFPITLLIGFVLIALSLPSSVAGFGPLLARAVGDVALLFGGAG